jgi:hypothetical protein
VRKVDALNDTNSCLSRADLDEPIFVLRAHDELAPGIVREWASRYIASKCETGSVSDAQVKKFQSAIALANAMEAWRREPGK